MSFPTITSNKLKGIGLVSLLAILAFLTVRIPLIGQTLRLSPLIIGVVLGILFANTLRHHVPAAWEPGIKYCSKEILRLSIIFYGFRLTLNHIVAVGWQALVIDLLIVSSVLVIGYHVGRRLGLDRDTSLLTSCGSAICGAAAVLGTEPVLGAKSEKTVIAVSTVVIFGTIAMFLYPTLYSLGLFKLEPHIMGIYTGSTLHEVAHVAGAGETMGHLTGHPELAGVATITKMIRVILLAPVLLILSRWVTTRSNGHSHAKVSIPWFAIWFIVAILVNSLLHYLFGLANHDAGYDQAVRFIEVADTFGLTMAMAALGMDATIAKFKQAGPKPFLLALILFAWLMGFGYLLASSIGKL